jgi:hypothetical protein
MLADRRITRGGEAVQFWAAKVAAMNDSSTLFAILRKVA